MEKIKTQWAWKILVMICRTLYTYITCATTSLSSFRLVKAIFSDIRKSVYYTCATASEKEYNIWAREKKCGRRKEQFARWLADRRARVYLCATWLITRSSSSRKIHFAHARLYTLLTNAERNSFCAWWPFARLYSFMPWLVYANI